MNNRISSKLAALAIALMMNGLVFGGLAVMFDAQAQPHWSLISMARQIVAIQWLI